MFYTFLQTIVTTILLGDIFQRRYPEQFEQAAISFSINAVYLVTRIEILLKKGLRLLNAWMDTNPALKKFRTDVFEFMRKFRQMEPELVYVKEGIIYNHIIEGADFLLYSFIPDNTTNSLSNLISKKIIIPVENSDINNRINNYSQSDIKFMMVELTIKTVSSNNISAFKIDLKTDRYDFYGVGNRFSKPFFKYYLRNMLNYTEEFKEDEEWSLKIVDHNVNTETIHFHQGKRDILIEKDDYFIID